MIILERSTMRRRIKLMKCVFPYRYNVLNEWKCFHFLLEWISI